MTGLIGADEGLAVGSAVTPNGEKQPCIRAFSLPSHHAQAEGVMDVT